MSEETTVELEVKDGEPAVKIVKKSNLFGLGTVIETGLSKIGVTSERVEKWLGRKCGCKARRDKIDKLSKWVHAKLRGEDPEPLPGLDLPAIESQTGENPQAAEPPQ